MLARRQQPWIHPARVHTHTSTPTPDHMRSFLSPEVPVGDPFDSPTYYSIVGTSMHGIHAIVTTAEYDFFALACDRAGAFPRRGGTGAAGHSMALQCLAEALKGDADSMEVEPDVGLTEGRLVLMLDSVPEQEVLTQVEADAEPDGFEDAHEGDAAQAAADAARMAHQELVARHCAGH